MAVSENVLPGHQVVIVTATDQDLGEDGHVMYSIVSALSGESIRGCFVRNLRTAVFGISFWIKGMTY